MKKKKVTGCELARELCEKFRDTPSRTLARKLRNEYPEQFLTLNTAEMAVRSVRNACGKRKHTICIKNPRPKQPSGWVPKCPSSSAEPWLPVFLDIPSRVLSLSDIHLPYHSQGAVESAVEYGMKLKPDILILNGDIMDFYRCSRFQQDLRKRTLTEEVLVGREFLRWIRSKFKTQRIIYKVGNHDQRWDVYIWNRCPEMFDMDNLQLQHALHFEEFGIERIDDNPIMAGELPILHGHELGKSLSTPVNPARTAFLRANHSVLIGHLHQPSSHPAPDMFHKEMMTWSQGCLCDLYPEYARVNRWAWGFAWIDIAKDKQFEMHNCRISNDYKVRAA